MPRTEARLHTAIWQNPDFIGLPATAQRLYMLVVSQADVTLAGVVAYVPHRWVRLAPDSTLEEVAADLKLLDARRFIAVDEDTGELLVRKFPRHDGVLKNSKLVTGMWTAYRAIYSPTLRSVFLGHLPDDIVSDALDRGDITDADIPPPPALSTADPTDPDTPSPASQDGLSPDVGKDDPPSPSSTPTPTSTPSARARDATHAHHPDDEPTGQKVFEQICDLVSRHHGTHEAARLRRSYENDLDQPARRKLHRLLGRLTRARGPDATARLLAGDPYDTSPTPARALMSRTKKLLGDDA